MDDILRQLFPPRRNTRHRPLRSGEQDAAWADTLDWQTNDYDFHRLLQRLHDRLDSHYRQEFGMRLDQLAPREELVTAARRAASWYQHAEQRYRTACIYDYLYHELDHTLSKRARRMFDRRHKLAEDFVYARKEV
jgi:hypothetical protein